MPHGQHSYDLCFVIIYIIRDFKKTNSNFKSMCHNYLWFLDYKTLNPNCLWFLDYKPIKWGYEEF